MGKPPSHRTRHPGLLSLSRRIWHAGWDEYLVKTGAVNRHITARIRGLAVFAECLAKDAG